MKKNNFIESLIFIILINFSFLFSQKTLIPTYKLNIFYDISDTLMADHKYLFNFHDFKFLEQKSNPYNFLQNGALRSEGKTLINNNWVTTKRTFRTFENNLNIKNAYQYFDNQSYSSYTIFYNQYQKISKIIVHLLDWIDYYEYDANGFLVEIKSIRNGNNFMRRLFSYDPNGNLIELIDQYWFIYGWDNTSKTIYIYDNNNFLIEEINYGWDYQNQQWAYNRKKNYLNNSSGYKIIEIVQYWSSNQWTNYLKYEYIRDQNNLILTAYIFRWLANTWAYHQKTEYLYTSNNEPLQTKIYKYENLNWNLYFIEDYSILMNEGIFVFYPLSENYLNTIPIHWIAVGCNNINIYFSSNKGSTWVSVATNIPDTGNYMYYYSIPNVNYFNSCKIKISKSSNPSVYDENFGFFSLFNENLEYRTKVFRFNANKLDLAINDQGVIADVYPLHIGDYDGNIVLYSGGLFLSGYTGNFLWANGIMTASRINDYSGGSVNSSSDSNFIYVIRSSNSHFGPAWLLWSEAVNKGAYFYDGNGDGIYNPIDLNGNGIWDINEDRPDFLGDLTAWCTYSDKVPSSQRRYSDVPPQGIEISQTMFASSDQNSDASNIVFIRYRIKNTGQLIQKFDSVYFSVALDPDIGDYSNDLAGCDSTKNFGYCYQTTNDNVFGNNPPVFLVKLLQGPHTYIPGITFIDINGNNKYDEGVDIPKDTAYYKNGPYLGIKVLPGAKNLSLTSFTHYMQSHTGHGDPSNRFELRNYMVGGVDKFGNRINVCSWPYGNGNSIPNCNQINPKFMYSGNPILNSGWLNIVPADQRMMLNIGPFNLEADKPVDIMVAYVVGRGDTPLNSLLRAKEIAQSAELYYKSNFLNLPSSIENEQNLSILDFKLFQNYPNPFNPSTRISWQSPIKGRHVIKLYDILGREIATILDEFKEAGRYDIEFNPQVMKLKLSSGIYFYKLQINEYSEVKKMIYLK